MLSAYLRLSSATLLCFPLVALAAPFPGAGSQQITFGAQKNVGRTSPININTDVASRFSTLVPGISKSLFDEFNDLAKLVDITNCVESLEGITYPFECNSFCREFPGLKLLRQWNSNDNLAEDEGEGTRGYVAVDHDGGKIVVAIAGGGSSSPTTETVDYGRVCDGCKVHKGFLKGWVETEEVIADLVKQYVEDKELPYQLVIVGSQNGGAVTTLAAVEFVARGWNPELTTFGQPRVGNDRFAEFLEKSFTPSTYRRVTHISDPTSSSLTVDNTELAHYEPSFLITKPYAPYTPSDILQCTDTSQPGCSIPSTALVPATSVPAPADYFHHSDSCLSGEVSIFSFVIEITEFDLGFDDALGLGFGLKKRDLEEKADLDADADPDAIVSDARFTKTFALVEPPPPVPKPPVYIPEYEDKELYAAMAGSPKAQSMWIKPPASAGATTGEKQKQKSKRGRLTDGADPTAESAALRNAIDMLDKVPTPPAQYEDKEIYDSMEGFDRAQRMWIKKPEGVAGKMKMQGDGEVFGDDMVPESDGIEVERRGVITIDPVSIFEGWAGMTEERKIISHEHALTVPEQHELGRRHSTLNIKVLASNETEAETTSELEKRGFDRALRFFNAPKDVLDAQLAANQENAAYQAQQRALAGGQGGPDAGESGDPDEDYFRKGGSVLLLNGRPLEVDGKPVLFEPKEKKVQEKKVKEETASMQKRSPRGPGLGLKKGGLRSSKDCDKDRVTRLSSAPGDTRSVSEVGGFANAFPLSFGEEVVNVQQGRNVVLMNGQPMPANFAQKEVFDSSDSGAGDVTEGGMWAPSEEELQFVRGLGMRPKVKGEGNGSEPDRFLEEEGQKAKVEVDAGSVVGSEGEMRVSVPVREKEKEKEMPAKEQIGGVERLNLKDMWSKHEKAGTPILNAAAAVEGITADTSVASVDVEEEEEEE